jgi:hypothetical protein
LNQGHEKGAWTEGLFLWRVAPGTLDPGQYVPRPIALRPARCERSMTELASEVLALSKMNWNSTQFDGHLPVSIRTARDVSDVIRRLDEGAPIEPRYAFYM